MFYYCSLLFCCVVRVKRDKRSFVVILYCLIRYRNIKEIKTDSRIRVLNKEKMLMKNREKIVLKILLLVFLLLFLFLLLILFLILLLLILTSFHHTLSTLRTLSSLYNIYNNIYNNIIYNIIYNIYNIYNYKEYMSAILSSLIINNNTIFSIIFTKC